MDDTERSPDKEKARRAAKDPARPGEKCRAAPGAWRPRVNRGKCEGKSDCVAVCPYGVFEVRRIADAAGISGGVECGPGSGAVDSAAAARLTQAAASSSATAGGAGAVAAATAAAVGDAGEVVVVAATAGGTNVVGAAGLTGSSARP